jgi:hypothetical protein
MKRVKLDEKKEQFPKFRGEYPIAFRRWLIREIESGEMSIALAVDRFNFQSKNPEALLRNWKKRYAPQIALTLPVMSEKEKQKLEALEKQIKELEKQLGDAKMKNIALETLIDVAEEQLNVSIRKKVGPRQ